MDRYNVIIELFSLCYETTLTNIRTIGITTQVPLRTHTILKFIVRLEQLRLVLFSVAHGNRSLRTTAYVLFVKVLRLDVAIYNADIELKRKEERYKRYFDKHVDSRDLGRRVGDYVYIDPKGARLPSIEKRNYLQHNLLGPFKVLRLTELNVTLQ